MPSLKFLKDRSNVPILVLLFPFTLILVDIGVRGKEMLQWSLSACGIYLLSLAVAVFLWIIFFRASCFLYKLNRFCGSVFVLLCFLIEVAFLIVSYGFYAYFDGIPNYYAWEYLLQETRDTITIAQNTVTIWHYLTLIVLTGSLSIFWLWQVRRYKNVPLYARQALVGVLLLPLGLWGVGKEIRYNDQAVIPDLNALMVSSNMAFKYLVLDRELKGSGIHHSKRMTLTKKQTGVPANVIVVLNESLRRLSMPSFGYEKDITPFMSQFIGKHSEEVFLFPKAYANSTTTMLSVPSLLTGVSPVLPGKVLHQMPLIFDYGKAVGYQTFFISSQSFNWRNLDKFFQTPTIDYFWNKEIGNAPQLHDLGTTDRIMINVWKNIMNRINNRPFLGVIQTLGNHYPYYTANPTSDLLKNYDRSIVYLDSIMADMFGYLEKNELLENTIVIFTSDHGEAFGEHGYHGHLRTYYEEEIGIPFWLYISKSLQKYYNGQVINLQENTAKNVSNLDLIPTVIDLLKVEDLPPKITDNFMGNSLLSEFDSNRPIYMLNNSEVSNYKIFMSVGILQGDCKYLLIKDKGPFREELYNVAQDPKEENNLIKQFPRKRKEFYNQLSRFEATRKLLKMARISG